LGPSYVGADLAPRCAVVWFRVWLRSSRINLAPPPRGRAKKAPLLRVNGMNEDLSIPIDNHRTLWLTEISRATCEDQALDNLGGDGGVFVVLEDEVEGTFEVLAKAASI
jgi:hypothetical protein